MPCFQFSCPRIGFEKTYNGLKWYGELLFAFFSLKQKKGDPKHKKGTQRGPKSPKRSPGGPPTMLRFRDSLSGNRRQGCHCRRHFPLPLYGHNPRRYLRSIILDKVPFRSPFLETLGPFLVFECSHSVKCFPASKVLFVLHQNCKTTTAMFPSPVSQTKPLSLRRPCHPCSCYRFPLKTLQNLVF